MRRLALLLAALCGADLDAPMPMLKVTLHHGAADKPVSYTHLTLPTILLV